MNTERRAYANWNLLDFLQFIFIKHQIRLAKKNEQNHILFLDVVRPNVFKRFEKLGYRVFAQGGASGCTWIFW